MEKQYVYFPLSKETIVAIATQGLNVLNEGGNYPGICSVEVELCKKKKTKEEGFDNEGFKKEEYEKITQDILNFDSLTITAKEIKITFSAGSFNGCLSEPAVAYGKQARGTFYKRKKYFPSEKIWFQVPVSEQQFTTIYSLQFEHTH